MKKSLLLAAALFATSSAFALDMYVVGNDVNGRSWILKADDAKMTETASGVYEWNGTTLGNQFKINDGTWDTIYNIGSGGSNIALNTPYSYYMGDGSGDIYFDGFQLLNNPKIVLDMNAGTIVLSGTPGEVTPPDPNEITFYIIGDNVNGKSWSLAQSDCAFTPNGNGIYRWEGEVLGTGFKINDGSWSNAQYNIGGFGNISMNQPYHYWADGSSPNISFDGFTILYNPVVELDLYNETITLVSGTHEGLAQWYITGINGVYELNDNWVLTETESGVFTREVSIEEVTGKCKVSDTGWSHQLGTNQPEEVFIDSNNLIVTLEEVNGQGGDIPYELSEGTYTVIFNYNEYTLEFKSITGVSTILMGEDKDAVYYNLQGIRVQNPGNGIFVKVSNGKAVKVAVSK